MSYGWYLHHHGSGHLARFLAVRPFVDAEVVVFSSLAEPTALPPRTRWIVLSRDDDGPTGEDPTAHGRLHWAPLQNAGHRGRLARIAAESLAGMTTMVVDVSAEVALFARLLGLRVVLFTQPGARTDAPHEAAFAIADRIIAPWPAALSRPAHLAGLDVVHTGGITRFDGRSHGSDRAGVLLYAGSGGTDVTAERLAEVPVEPRRSLGLDAGSRVADPWEALTGAEIVLSFAGQNSVADLAAAHARVILLPQPRPFDEQHAMAQVLADAGLVVVAPVWPSRDEWPELLRRARALEPRWEQWQTEGAAARAGAAIEEVR